MNRVRNQIGVTLMELLIALAILGVLAAIGIPLLTGNIRTAKNADAQNTLRSIFLMEKNYFSENYCYYITSGVGNQASTINQYLMGSATPNSGPIVPDASNDFDFYITAGVLGSAGSCLGANSNDYIVYAQSRSVPSIIYSINQQNVKTGF